MLDKSWIVKTKRLMHVRSNNRKQICSAQKAIHHKAGQGVLKWHAFCFAITMLFLNRHKRQAKSQVVLLSMLVSMSVSLQAATKVDIAKVDSLYHFTQFIEWPKAAGNNDYFNLCIIGKAKFDKNLNRLKNKLVNHKPIVLSRQLKASALNTCNMVFIANDSKINLQKTLHAFKKRPTLTVSDQPGFIEKGGMIGFIHEKTHVAFEINLTTANDKGFNIGIQLLKLAKRVVGSK